MDLRNHYKKLHSSALSSINKKGFNYDKELDNPSDLRRGLTLLIRPNKKIKEAFELFIHQAREVLPDQYFYSVDDIHVTVMPIVSCYSGFSMEGIEIDRYDEIIQKALRGVREFKLDFTGVFASASCLIIKGYPVNGYLEHFRQNLRNAFSGAKLEQSLDKRYKLVTAHSTVVRFKQPIKDKKKVIELVKAFSDFEFGCQSFEQLEFVYNDWYQRKSIVQLLKSYNLKQ
tara:strand:- start:20072 stop:20758 length:687 start_codon:yes stop_codon:yes gene_type:complete